MFLNRMTWQVLCHDIFIFNNQCYSTLSIFPYFSCLKRHCDIFYLPTRIFPEEWEFWKVSIVHSTNSAVCSWCAVRISTSDLLNLARHSTKTQQYFICPISIYWTTFVFRLLMHFYHSSELWTCWWKVSLVLITRCELCESIFLEEIEFIASVF